MYQIWLAAGCFLLTPVGALMLTCMLPWWRCGTFLYLWRSAASSGFIAVTVAGMITGIWLPVVAYAASLLLCDLTAVVGLQILKRTRIRIQRYASKRYYPLDSPGWPQDRRRGHEPPFSGHYP